MDNSQRDYYGNSGDSAHDALAEVRKDKMDDEKTESGLLTEDE